MHTYMHEYTYSPWSECELQSNNYNSIYVYRMGREIFLFNILLYQMYFHIPLNIYGNFKVNFFYEESNSVFAYLFCTAEYVFPISIDYKLCIFFSHAKKNC